MTRLSLLLLAVIASTALIVVQVRKLESAMERSASHALGKAFGSDVGLNGPVEARLFPRPHLIASEVSIRDEESGSHLDIQEVEATPSVASLFSGRFAISQLRLTDATGTIDGDRLFTNFSHPGLHLLGRSLPSKIVISSGVVAVRSTHPALAGLMTNLNGVVEGLDHNGAAVLSGHGIWRGQSLEMSARLEPFFDFVLGRETTGSLKLRLPSLTATLDGQLRAGIHGGFEGKVSAATSSLETLLRTNGCASAVGQVINRASFTGSGLASQDNITFSDTRLVIDATQLEGSLAWQPNRGRGAWTGTFATDRLDLTPLLDVLPQAHGHDGTWSDVRWLADRALWGDVDLRVSANQAKLGPIDIEDAAFSALARDGRVEVSLSEAKSLDGLIRGRAVASLEPAAVNLKVDLSMSQMDLESLSRSLGQRALAGSASGHFTGEARGSSPKSLVESLTGHGQVSIREGSLPPLGSVADVSPVASAMTVWPLSDSPQPFDLGTADVEVGGGDLRLEKGRLLGQASNQMFQGGASLLGQTFTLAVTDVPTDSTAVEREGVTTNLAGTWGRSIRVLRANQSKGRSRFSTRATYSADFLP